MNRLLTPVITALFGLFLILIISCNDDPNELGINLLPKSDNFVIYCDTTSPFYVSQTFLTKDFLTYPLYRKNSFDNYLTDGYGYTVYIPDSFNIIGNYKDTIFGHSESAYFFNMDTTPSKYPVLVNTYKFILNYLEFEFKVSKLIGKTDQKMDFKLYETTKKLYDTTETYSNLNYLDFIGQTPLITLTNIGQAEIGDKLSLKFAFYDTSYIKNNIYKYIFTDTTDIIGQPGYCIVATPSSGDGAAYLINSIKSGINVHYECTVKPDSIVYDTIKIPLTYRASTYKLDNSNTRLEKILNTPPEQQTYMALLGGTGTFGRINIDTSIYKSWNDSTPVAFHKVELLLIPEDLSAQGIEPDQYPRQLIMYAWAYDSTKYFLDDHYLGDAFYGGKWDETHGYYKFNITKYFVERLKGYRKNAYFELKELNYQRSFSRVLFKNNYKLRIIYSKLNK